MDKVRLGKSGLMVTRIGFGGIPIQRLSEEDAILVIRKCLDHGINFVDTAPIYSDNKSEEIVGKAIKDNRDSFIVASKVGAPSKLIPGVPPKPNEVGLSRKYIMKSVEDSLKRLQTDFIDLLYVHEPDFDTPIEETLATLDDLVRQGKILYL